MNIVFISPQFPPNFYHFIVHMNNLGARVLGIGDTPWAALRPELQNSLTEYYHVDNMEDYDQVHRACGHFIHLHGRIDRLESLNEYWLETDARLRLDFNIPGFPLKRLNEIKNKSGMKEVFNKAGIPTAQGTIVDSPEAGFDFAKKVGFPLIVKPDIGVGASNTWKISNEDELSLFFNNHHHQTFIMEEFITGTIFSFDGIVDREGTPVFVSSMQYQSGLMELVTDQLHTVCWTLREIPEDLYEIGVRTLKAFNIKEKFFHFEYFRTPEGELKAIEVNMRPPGGSIIDVMNYANDIDLYFQWPNIMINGHFDSDYQYPYHAAFITRRKHYNYRHDKNTIFATFGKSVLNHKIVESAFRAPMGDELYIVRNPEISEIEKMVKFIHETI